MKKNSILINMGRGGLVDEKDLFNILNENNIKAAVLDVLNNEPPKLNNPLLSLKNCYITPHVAWAGKQSRRNLIELLIKNVEAYIDGNPINTVN